MYFIRMPIKFVGGCAFFTPAAELIGTYSIEVEYSPYVKIVAAYYLCCAPLFFWWRYGVCYRVISEAMLLTTDTHSVWGVIHAF